MNGKEIDKINDFEFYDKPLCKNNLFEIRTGNDRMKQIKLTHYQKKDDKNQ